MNDLNNPYPRQGENYGSIWERADFTVPVSGHLDQAPPRGPDPQVRTVGAGFSGTEARGSDSITGGLDLTQPSSPLADAPSFRASIPVRGGLAIAPIERAHYPTAPMEAGLYEMLYPWDARRDIGLGETNWYGNAFLTKLNQTELLWVSGHTGYEATDFQNPNLFQRQLTVATLVPQYGGPMQTAESVTLNILSGQGLIQRGNHA